jgi:hypothetical protein
VIAVDEDEIDRIVVASRIGSRRAQPFNASVGYRTHLVMCNVPLHAEAGPADRERIDGAEHAVGMHRGTQPAGRDAMPYTDLDQPASASRVASKAVTFGARRLRRR